MIFDLVFVGLVMAGVVTLVLAAVAGLRGRRRRAVSLLLRFGSGVAIYLGAVITVSLVSSQRVLEMGDDWCFDDWCVTVDEVTQASELGPPGHLVAAEGVYYVVRLHLSNHGRGRAQRASSAAVRLLDGRGHWYEVSGRGQDAFEATDGPAAPLTSLIAVGQSVPTVRVFDVPKDVRDIGLNVRHPLGPAPGLFIIGDQASLFHKPTIVRLN